MGVPIRVSVSSFSHTHTTHDTPRQRDVDFFRAFRIELKFEGASAAELCKVWPVLFCIVVLRPTSSAFYWAGPGQPAVLSDLLGHWTIGSCVSCLLGYRSVHPTKIYS